MKSTLTKISAIKRNPNNPRILKDDKFAKLTQSIKDFPQMLDIRPIVVNDDMIVLGGNMRLKACKEAGLKEVPVIKVSDLTEEQQREFIIKDNVGFGEWDWDLLANDWDADLLDDWGLELDFDPADEDNAGLTDEDDVPEVAEEVISKAGDIWLLGEHRVMCGDSTNSDNVNSLIDNNQIDLVYTDPPYGIDYHANTEGSGTGLSATKRTLHDKIIGDEDITIAVKVVDLVLDMFADSSMVFWGANYYCQAMPTGYGWLFWDKEVDMPTFSDGEFAFTNRGVKSSVFKHKWTGMLRDSERGAARLHPNQKPIALADWCFDNYGDPQTILDLFLGSGSTLIAAEKKNRKCYGMELDPKYVDVIIKRWQDYTGKKAIHAITGDEYD